jgi:hypothetical protein
MNRVDLLVAILGVLILGCIEYGVVRGFLLMFVCYLLMPSGRGPNG